jgi:hypothetical protein
MLDFEAINAAAMSSLPDLARSCLPARRWSRLRVGVAVVFERWARQAIALGWGDLDLFGCFPRSPVKRLDHQGLCWFLGHDTELIALTASTARFRTPTGAIQSVTRKPIREPGGVPLWALCKNWREMAPASQQAHDGGGA